MSTVIQIKRTYSADPPPTSVLEEGELAYSQDSSGNGANAILYIEALGSDSNAVLHKIGGKYYTDYIDNANANAISNTLVIRDSFANFSANVITANLFYGVSNTTNQLNVARSINLAGELEGNVLFDGSQDVTIVANLVTKPGVTFIQGTVNQVSVDNTIGNVRIFLPDDVTIENLTVANALIFNGIANTINSTTTTVADPLFRLANANPFDSLDIGIVGEYVENSVTKYTGLFRDASAGGDYKLFANLESNPDTTVLVSGAGYTTANLVANIKGSVITDLLQQIRPADGGTGITSFVANAIAYGIGVTQLGFVAGVAGEVLQIAANGVPFFGNLDGGTF